MQDHRPIWIKIISATFAISTSAAQATPISFQCSNRTSETRCEAGQCSTETEDFTPIQLRREAERIELCAYSDCWEGVISFHHARDKVELFLADLHGEPRGALSDNSVAIIFDRGTHHAQISFADFALVMDCSAQPLVG